MKKQLIRIIMVIVAAVLLTGLSAGCGSGSGGAELTKPDLLNYGYGEEHVNSKDTIYLYVQWEEGAQPDGAVLFRKSGEDDFEEIGYTLISDGFEGCGIDIMDDTVTPGEIYTYKVRTTAEKNGETVYSPYSDEVTIPAVNFTGEYEVSSVTDAWNQSPDGTFVIRVKSNEYNGDTVFSREKPMRYCVRTNDDQEEAFVFDAALSGYCSDYKDTETDWKEIPRDGVRLGAGETVYLKYTLTVFSSEVALDGIISEEIMYGGSDSAESVFIADDENWGTVEYEGPGFGTTYMTLDLVSGQGSAYGEWD